MKIESRPVPPDPFQKILVSIVIESAQEAKALQRLCDDDSDTSIARSSKEAIDFLSKLRPHVTPA